MSDIDMLSKDGLAAFLTTRKDKRRRNNANKAIRKMFPVNRVQIRSSNIFCAGMIQSIKDCKKPLKHCAWNVKVRPHKLIGL